MRRTLFLAVTIVVAALVAGCAGRIKNVLLPGDSLAEPPGAAYVSMMVATTRSNRNALPGQMFTGERGGKLSFADITVSIPADANRKIGEIQWPKRLPANPATDFVTVKADVLTQQQAISEFDSRIKRTHDRRVLLFVHGYNNTFEEAVYRFAQFLHDSRAPVMPVLFTWPSRGSLLSYGYDHESTNYSRDALEALVAALNRDPNVKEIVILAHSMGNWVTLEALRQMAIRNGSIAAKISTVMLAAPDVDFDVFRRQIAAIGAKRPPFIIFTSQDDEALAVSRRVWGEPRLGAINADAEPYRSVLARDQVMVIDLTKVRGNDSVNHAKFAESPAVVQLIGQRLAAGQTLTDTNTGLGERLGRIAVGAASTVGAAAGIAVAAPIAIIDPQTRDGLGAQFEMFGASVANTLPAPLMTNGPSSTPAMEDDAEPAARVAPQRPRSR